MHRIQISISKQTGALTVAIEMRYIKMRHAVTSAVKQTLAENDDVASQSLSFCFATKIYWFCYRCNLCETNKNGFVVAVRVVLDSKSQVSNTYINFVNTLSLKQKRVNVSVSADKLISIKL